MARVFLYDGAICVWRDREIERLPFPPSAEFVADFDESTNEQLITEFNTDYTRFSFVAGVLHRDGLPVVFNPESVERLTRLEIKDQLADRLLELQAIIDGLDASNNTQLRTMVKTLARNQRRILRLLSRLI